MSLCRVLRIAVFAFAAAVPAASVSAQEKSSEALKLKKPEMAQYQVLTALVDAVMAGRESAPFDVKLRLQPYFVKSATGVYVPYVLEMSGGRFTSFPVAMYVRAVPRPSPPPAEQKGPYPFTDVQFFNDAKRFRAAGADRAEILRGLQLPAGEYDVYIAMIETAPRNTKVAAKRVVHIQALTVPDFSGPLTTSSVVVASSFDESPQQITTEQQLDEPFTFGGFRIGPATTSTFTNAVELLFVFFIYNEAAGASGKPDVDVNYYFFRAAEAKPFSRAPTTAFNALTLPAEFDLSAGHQLVVGQGIPLASFAPGDYRLEIRIADNAKKQTITRNVPFAVVQ